MMENIHFYHREVLGHMHLPYVEVLAVLDMQSGHQCSILECYVLPVQVLLRVPQRREWHIQYSPLALTQALGWTWDSNFLNDSVLSTFSVHSLSSDRDNPAMVRTSSK